MKIKPWKFFIPAFVFFATLSTPSYAFIGAFLGSIFGGGALSSIASSILSYVVQAVVGSIVGSVFGGGKKRRAQDQQRTRSVMVNKQSSNEPLGICYGRRRIGGTRVYIETADSTLGDADKTGGTQDLAVVLALCEGQMGDLKRVYFNDEIIFDGTFTHGTVYGADDDVEPDPEGDPVVTNKYSDTVTMQYFDGRDDQVSSSVITDTVGTDNWSTNHRLRGVAYLAFRLRADAEKYQGGLPTITCELEGKQITSTADYSTVAAGEDQNPVDVIYDYLTNTRYGKGIDGSASGKIDRASFTQARTDLGNYFKINGMLQTDIPMYENIETITSNSNLMLIYTNGQYKLKARKSGETAQHTFDKTDFVGQVDINMPSKKQKRNRMTVTFPNKDDTFRYNEDVRIIDSSTYLTEDNNEILENRFELDLITDATLAESIATYKMDFSRNLQAVNFETTHTKIPVEVGDVVGLTNADYGFDGDLYRVIQIEITTDNTQKISAQKYDGGIELV